MASRSGSSSVGGGTIGLLFGAALLLGTTTAAAAPEDYGFELVGTPTRIGSEVQFGVRVVRAADGSPVIGALIFPWDFNMAPEGMAHSTWARALRATEPGVQPIAAVPPMAGRWLLILTAVVPGERKEIGGELVVVVPD